MAGLAKPNVEGLNKEGSINFISAYQITSNTGGGRNDIEVANTLLDGSTTKLGTYGSILFVPSASSSLVLSVDKRVNIWAVGNVYSDGGGSTGKNVKLEKYQNGAYVLIGEFPTYSDSVWYKLFSNLEAGQYRISASTAYVGFDEWYIEDSSNKKMAIKNPTTSQVYSLADKTLINIPSTSNQNMILHGIEQGKEIQLDVPFDKVKLIKDTSEVLGNGKTFTHTIDLSEWKTKKIML